MKKAFMSLKFHDGDKDKKKIDDLTEALAKAGIQNVVMARDVEKYGKSKLPDGTKLMPDYAFPAMEKCDMLIVEFSEKGVGLGIGAGFAYAKKIPIYVIAKTGSDISSTMNDIAKEIIFYDDPSDLTKEFKRILMPKIILASKSAIRKKMLEEENIQFEVIVSNADETPDMSKSYEDQLKDISMRKAMKIFSETSSNGKRIIVAADQNIVYKGVMYGKPKTIEDARSLIKTMFGSDEIYAYTGNTVIYADGDKIIKTLNETDISKMKMDIPSDIELEDYLQNGKPLTKCGGILIADTPFLHLVDGKMSTASGMTIEYLQDMLSSL